ncbi:hypothetical protein FHX57_007574 [Paraburkholderia tropica]|uniref:Uncharacterized protein n=1 Tax=Paraburkholderia tropica TaxID=92647 RepID=A0ABX5MEM3_9BURK|nr:hypothetical protein [Paraburkholderia tropica]MBB2984703.1 hypothetical protein [Paraburkholderia tropica]MBB3005186.1 hypothetical protein [Paraburkholderia tropica]MBB6324144.1 hypothetical protein [Paraburkholderia tropica]PXX07879.1 hypothetical protein C7400_12830 [Paraburkholderia tropica]PZW73299.1 hypothetical protein C7399_12830 [Paraburkholderia tropica]
MKGCSLAFLGAVARAATFGFQTAFADVALPATRQSGDITYLSAGIGSDLSSALESMMHRYPLTLEFVGRHAWQHPAERAIGWTVHAVAAT